MSTATQIKESGGKVESEISTQVIENPQNLKGVFITGEAETAGALLVHKLLASDFQVRTTKSFIYRGDIFRGASSKKIITHKNLIEVFEEECDLRSYSKILQNLDVVVFFSNSGSDVSNFKDLVESAKKSRIKRFVLISQVVDDGDVFVRYLKNSVEDSFEMVFVGNSNDRSSVNVSLSCANQNQRIEFSSPKKAGTIVNSESKQHDAICNHSLPKEWYGNKSESVVDRYANERAEVLTCVIKDETRTIQSFFWKRRVQCIVALKKNYIFNKIFQFFHKPYFPFWGRIKFYIQTMSRFVDVCLLMAAVHWKPEQAYKFSTRKCLPHPDLRKTLDRNNVIPYSVNRERTSAISPMEEVNIVFRGQSFNIKQLDELKGPIFLGSFWDPIETSKDVTYITAGGTNALRLAKLGCKVVHFETNRRTIDGRIRMGDANSSCAWYDQSVADGLFKRISLFDEMYKASDVNSPYWFPSGSAFPAICALSFFAERVNVYGWDFYLNQKPSNMSYWQTLLSMYKLKLDVSRSRNHFESAMVNFYFASCLSNLANIDIHSYLGDLQTHKKLMNKIQRVFYNSVN